LPPSRLELEVTETALLIDHTSSADTLERLSALGARIALDDFGTGYSSLSHLRNFPLNKIKIDKSFVGEMTSSRDSAAIVTAVIDLAQKLGMTTTAEGIETIAQLRAIRVAGCTEAQGYLLGRPASILHAVDALGQSMPRDWTKGRQRSA
jgi:EAL domain-containing protein (putative c-di-GMP-specific phosphodiesterase class I)